MVNIFVEVDLAELTLRMIEEITGIESVDRPSGKTSGEVLDSLRKEAAADPTIAKVIADLERLAQVSYCYYGECLEARHNIN